MYIYIISKEKQTPQVAMDKCPEKKQNNVLFEGYYFFDYKELERKDSINYLF